MRTRERALENQWMLFRGPGFTLDVPTDWRVESSPTFQAMFLGSAEGELVRPNLVISLRPLQPEVTVEAVAEAAGETQHKTYPEFTILKEGPVRGGKGGFQRRYRWRNPDNNVAVVQMQAFFVNAQVLYTLTATRAEDTERARDLDDIFSTMIRSLAVIE